MRKSEVYIVQGKIKDKKQKQCDVGITAFNALNAGNATINKPIYIEDYSGTRVFTNNINDSVYFSSKSNAESLCCYCNKRFLDFDFEVIKCEIKLQLTPIDQTL